MRQLSAALFFVLSLSSFARAAEGILARLEARGFTCKETNEGQICSVKSVKTDDFTYSKPVAILVPKYLIDHQRNPNRLLLHLHGHSGICEGAGVSATSLVGGYDLFSQMIEAGANHSVMIVPLSSGQCTTFENELAPNFDKFREWVMGLTKPTTERWVISGHSGAYRAIGSILKSQAENDPKWVKKVDAAILLDSTYSSKASYVAKWKAAADVNPGLDLYTVYRKGGGTETGSRALKDGMPENHVEVIQSKTAEHCKVPNQYYGDLLKQSIERDGGDVPTGQPAASTQGQHAD